MASWVHPDRFRRKVAPAAICQSALNAIALGLAFWFDSVLALAIALAMVALTVHTVRGYVHAIHGLQKLARTRVKLAERFSQDQVDSFDLSDLVRAYDLGIR